MVLMANVRGKGNDTALPDREIPFCRLTWVRPRTHCHDRPIVAGCKSALEKCCNTVISPLGFEVRGGAPVQKRPEEAIGWRVRALSQGCEGRVLPGLRSLLEGSQPRMAKQAACQARSRNRGNLRDDLVL